MKASVAVSVVACAVTALSTPFANAYTRFVHPTESNSFIVGHTIDWPNDRGIDRWAFPRGMAR